MVKFISRFKDNGVYLEIIGDPIISDNYLIEFIDLNTNKIEYSNNIKINEWAEMQSTIERNWLIKITHNEQVVFERKQEDKFNAVFIKFVSASLGDNISWIPYVEEYRKINNVKVYVATYHNYLFDKVYPELVFMDKNTLLEDVNEVDKKFKINFYYKIGENYFSPGSDLPQSDMKRYHNVINFDYREISLQSIASKILGLPDVEIVPKVNSIGDDGPKIKGKYVVVAIQSTAQLKYWNNPFGWERLFDFLNRNGYKVVLVDKFKRFGGIGFVNDAPKSKNLIDKTNMGILDIMNYIKYAQMMITISSGLSWLSWAIGTPVVMVSGFSKPWYEFQSNIIRLHNQNVCNGCFNDTKIKFNSQDWKFCPRGMDFICSKAIQPKDVIDSVKKLMK